MYNPEAVEPHAAGLNNPDNEHLLATEWEIAVLNALSKVEEVGHEEVYFKRSKA